MSDKRKLNAEIEKCAKKIQEGVECFDAIWQKFQDATLQVYKKNLEIQMKKEVKKLQKLRDQVKWWATLDELKDKSFLLELRRIVEVRMERFREVERETRARTFIKDGVEMSKSAEPAERERQCVEEWLKDCIEKLNYQAEKLDTEVEALTLICKRKKSVQTYEQLASVQTRLDRHKEHTKYLETILRRLNNESVQVELIKEIQDDVNYYIECNEEPDFPQDFEVNYEQFAIKDFTEDNALATNAFAEEDKSGEKDVPSSLLAEQLRIRNQAPEDQTSSAKVATAEAITAPEVQCVASSKEEELPDCFSQSHHASSLDDSTQYKWSEPSLLDSLVQCSQKPLLDIPVQHRMPASDNSMKRQEQQQTTKSSIAEKAGVGQQDFAGTGVFSSYLYLPFENYEYFGKEKALIDVASIWGKKPPPPPPPAEATFSYFSNNVGARPLASSNQQAPPATLSPLAGGQCRGPEFSLPPPPGLVGVPMPNLDPQYAAANRGKMTNQQPSAKAFNAPAQANCFATDGSSRMMPSDAMGCGGAAMQNVDATAAPSYTAPTAPLQPTELPALSSALNFSYTLPGIVPPILPHPLTDEEKRQKALLEAAHDRAPLNEDWYPWPNGSIWRKTPFPTPSYYPQSIPKSPGGTQEFQGLADETLFWIFYYMGGTPMQAMAAENLNSRSWRFHRGNRMWFRRADHPNVKTDTHEEGRYAYFNPATWTVSIARNYRFDYHFLETGGTGKMR